MSKQEGDLPQEKQRKLSSLNESNDSQQPKQESPIQNPDLPQDSNEKNDSSSQSCQNSNNQIGLNKLRKIPAFESFDDACMKEILDGIKIDLSEEEKVKNRINDIKNGILNSPTIFEEMNLVVLKNSFISFLKSIVLEILKEKIDLKQPKLFSMVYLKKLKEMSKIMNDMASFIDDAYNEKMGTGKFKEIKLLNEKDITLNTMLYVLKEKETFKEINIQISSEKDLNSEIPQDF